MPAQINTPGPGQRLVSLFGLKGRFQPVLDEVIVPTVDVGAQEVQTRDCTAYDAIAAVAGAFPFAFLQNPAGSGIIARIKVIACIPASAGVIYVTTTLAPLISGGSSAFNKYWKDQDYPGDPVMTAANGTSTTDVSSSTAFTRFAGTGGLYSVFDSGREWVIHPGQTLQVTFGTVNVAMTALGFEWSEEPEVVNS